MEQRRQSEKYRADYVEGTTVRKLNTRTQYNRALPYEPEEEPLNIPGPRKKERQRRQDQPVSRKIVGRGIDFVSMVFLTAVMLVTVAVCLDYLKLQSDMREVDKTIVALEGELTDITDRNNAVEVGLEKKVDFDEVYRIAVGELGMVFPNKNEIINYQMDYRGHMQQNGEIPEVTEKSVLDQIFSN